MPEYEIGSDGISNERLFFYDSMSWYGRANAAPIHEWAQAGVDFHSTGKTYSSNIAIGMFSFYAGPKVYVLDEVTLSDPLRSRLKPLELYRIGHLPRQIPQGYVETIKDSFVNHLENPDLYHYYEKLDILIHKNIFSPGRIREIINFNLGKYDHYINHYNESLTVEIPKK
jgi:arabinofuranosyltransferase